MAFLSCLPCIKRPLEEVTELDLRHKTLDDVPNDIFNYERTLEVLNLDSNNIRDLPRPLFHCHGLQHLGLSDNEIGVIPPAISSLNQLVSLDVSRNILTDIPDAIKQCKHLEVLDVSVNPLQRLPEGCTQLVSLAELYLNDVFLEYLPANFGRLAKLRILELRENGLTSLPKSMSRLVNLTRVDLGQNQFSEVPEVLGGMSLLEELWLDGNRLQTVPTFIGNLINLRHLDLSVNQLTDLTDQIGCCTKLIDLTLSTNDLQVLPESLGHLTELITLKVDDNQLEHLPDSLGNMGALEEVFASENYLTQLPRSIGWLRHLHTLILDENDLQELPGEIGSCRNMKILSLYANRLTGVPQELGHITKLAVLNLAGNNIPHLPLSFVKLKQINAIWLTENQTKPLVQLNPDVDPYSGEKVLTNFLLPQQSDNDRDLDTQSESGSFHAAVWDEERSKRSLVKWAGEEQDLDKTGNLRRAPTPFPKEMRAMAKKIENLRDKKKAESPTAAAIRKKEKEFKSRPNNRRTERTRRSSQDQYSNNSTKAVNIEKGGSTGHNMVGPGGVMIKSAKVTKAPMMTGGNQHQVQQRGDDGQLGSGQIQVNRLPEGIRVSPDKVSRDSGIVSPSDAGSMNTEHSDHTITDFPPPPPPLLSTVGGKIPMTAADNQLSVQPPKQSAVGGAGLKMDASLHQQHLYQQRMIPPPVKAELVTNELDTTFDVMKPPPYHIAATKSKYVGDFVSKSANATGYSDDQPVYENQENINGRKKDKHTNLERKSSFLSDGTFESISESETSTAPSSLQTIVRAPYANTQYSGISEYYSSSSESSTSPVDSKEVSHSIKDKDEVINSLYNFETSSQATTDSELIFSSASKLRKVSEQLLSANSRTRSSVSGPAPPLMANTNGSNGLSSRPGSIATLNNGKQGNVGGGPGSIGQSSSSGSDSRPSSRLSLPVSVAGNTRPNSVTKMKPPALIHSTPINESYNQSGSYISPANTVGLPQISHQHNNNINNMKQQYHNNNQSFNSSSNNSLSTLKDSVLNTSGATTPVYNSKIPRLNMYGNPGGVDGNYPSESGGLLSTISQAALSDDESPPTTHMTSQPKFNTASLARSTPAANTPRMQNFQPNYENLESAKQQQKYTNSNNYQQNSEKIKSGIPRKIDLSPTLPSPVVPATSGGMTQGQYRAAASQATVATIPEDPGAYLPMASRKGSLIPLATSSPSGVNTASSHQYAADGYTSQPATITNGIQSIS